MNLVREMTEPIISQIKDKLKIKDKEYSFYNINKLDNFGVKNLEQQPKTIKILLEALARKADGKIIKLSLIHI